MRTMSGVQRSRLSEKEHQELDEFEKAPMYEHTYANHHLIPKKPTSVKPSNFFLNWLAISLLPWLLFLAMGVLIMFGLYLIPLITPLIIFCLIMATLLFMATGASSGNTSRALQGAVFLLAVCLGTVCGLANFRDNLFNYWSSGQGREYTNVAPDSLAAAHEDAGVLVFADDAKVAVENVVGFKSGKMFCVAPIIRREQAHGSPVQYWAAGTDCCHKRDSFTCGDANNKEAHSGLVFRNITDISSIFESDLKQYLIAAEMAKEEYGLTIGADPLFMVWVKDTEKQTYWYFIQGWMTWGEHGAMYLAFSIILGLLVQLTAVTHAKAAAKKEPASVV